MEEGDPAGKQRPQAGRRRRGEGDLGHQVEGPPPAGERLPDGVQVDLGLAGAGDAPQEEGAEAAPFEGRMDGGEGARLVGGEGMQDGFGGGEEVAVHGIDPVPAEALDQARAGHRQDHRGARPRGRVDGLHPGRFPLFPKPLHHGPAHRSASAPGEQGFAGYRRQGEHRPPRLDPASRRDRRRPPGGRQDLPFGEPAGVRLNLREGDGPPGGQLPQERGTVIRPLQTLRCGAHRRVHGLQRRRGKGQGERLAGRREIVSGDPAAQAQDIVRDQGLAVQNGQDRFEPVLGESGRSRPPEEADDAAPAKGDQKADAGGQAGDEMRGSRVGERGTEGEGEDEVNSVH